MDLEELKLVLDTIQSMGGDAKEFGIWWVLASFIPDVVSSVLLFIFGVLVVLCIYRYLLCLIRSENASFM